MPNLIIRFCWSIAFASMFATPCFAQMVNFLPAFDATLLDQNLDGTFESGGGASPSNEIRRTDGVVNQAYFFEFDVSGVTDSSTIISASLSFTVLETPTSPGDVAFFGYQADGIPTFPDDGNRPSLLIGSYDPISLGSGRVSVMLDATIVNEYALTGGYVGIRMQGMETDTLTSIRGIETTLIGDPPTLSLGVTAVPEPSALPLLLFVTIPVVLRSRRTRLPNQSKRRPPSLLA